MTASEYKRIITKHCEHVDGLKSEGWHEIATMVLSYRTESFLRHPNGSNMIVRTNYCCSDFVKNGKIVKSDVY